MTSSCHGLVLDPTGLHVVITCSWLNSLRPRLNRRPFADDIFKCIFLNENVWISIEISLKFVPKGPINNIPALVQIMAWRRPGDKPLSEPIMINSPTHICVSRPQLVKIQMLVYIVSVGKICCCQPLILLSYPKQESRVRFTLNPTGTSPTDADAIAAATVQTSAVIVYTLYDSSGVKMHKDQ